MEQQWYVTVGENDQRGPLTEEQVTELIESCQVSGADYCWTEGFEGWAPLTQVLAALIPDPGATTVTFHTGTTPTSLPLDEITRDDDIRIFTVIDGDQVAFAVARMNGDLIAYPVTRIEVQ